MPVAAYLEIGSKRVFAGALDWPGWCRSARDEDDAVETLATYGSRYARALRGTRLGFTAPRRHVELRVRERLPGDATTDFGAPSIQPAGDARPLAGADLDRQITILRACWRTFDRTVEGARGVELTKGPRGGGRDLGAIVGHVVGAESGYGRMIVSQAPSVDGRDAIDARDDVRDAVIEALQRATTEGIPERGPRGGKLWTARYFVRRAAWHVLDHAWEIEDRS
jgi:hypothetical protein